MAAANPQSVVDTGALTAPFVSLSEAEARTLLEDVYGETGTLVQRDATSCAGTCASRT
jgi:hypothetical protein